SSVTGIMHFGLGNEPVDSIEIIWPGHLNQVIVNPSINKVLDVNIKNAAPLQQAPVSAFAQNNWFTNITSETGVNYVHQQRDFIDFNIQKLLPHKFTEYVPGIAVGDI